MSVDRVAHAAGLLAACAIVLSASACRESGMSDGRAPAVVFHSAADAPTYGAVDVVPLDVGALRALARSEPSADEWRAVFVVRAGDSAGVPMMGTYRMLHDTLRFVPRFAPTFGTTYYATFSGAALRSRVGHPAAIADAAGTLRIAAPSGVATTVVAAVYPSADTVPMNLLRMYIEFSAPMSVGESNARVRLLDDAGREVPDAFLVVAGAQELWDTERRRLTVFFDPGRIKRNLTPNETLGLPLQAGRSYRLVVDSGWRDARGLPLARGFEKRVYVGPVDRAPVRTAAWRVTAPEAAGRGALVVAFPKALDGGLAQRMLVVKRASGEVVPGDVTLGTGERSWRFVPSGAWRAGEYVIEVDTELEDVAGNNLRRSFDVMPGDTGARGVSAAVVRVGFSVR